MLMAPQKDYLNHHGCLVNLMLVYDATVHCKPSHDVLTLMSEIVQPWESCLGSYTTTIGCTLLGTEN